MKKIVFLSVLWIQFFVVFAQQKLPVTVTEVFQKGAFRANYFGGLRWLGNGAFYTSLETVGKTTFILKHQNPSGNVVDTILNTALLKDTSLAALEEYSWNSQENLLLLETASEPIYRRSSKLCYFGYELQNKQLKSIAGGEKCAYAIFSAAGN